MTTPSNTLDRQYWTPKNLAMRWVVSERQVRDMAARREIPAMRIGKLWRFDPERISAWERVNGRTEQASRR